MPPDLLLPLDGRRIADAEAGAALPALASLTGGGRPRPKEGLGETMVHEAAHEVSEEHDNAWHRELGRLWAEEVASEWPSDWRKPRLTRA